MVPIALVAASSVLMWAAFPPIGFGPLAFVAPVPLFLALRSVERPFHALALGFIWGAAFFGLLLNWLMVLGFVAWFPLAILMGAFSASYAFVVWLFRMWPSWRWWMIATGGWVALEFIRGRFPFGGFPWGDIGYPAAGIPGAIGSVQWIGPSGWTAMTIAFAAGLTLFIENHRDWRMAVDAGSVIVLLIVGGALFAPSPGGQVWRTVIVQGGSPCPQVRCQNENQRIYERHMQLTRQIPAGTVEFVVWPENSTGTPYEPEGNEQVRAEIIEQARRLDAHMLISGTRVAGDGEFYNVNVMYSPDGVKVGEYLKRHPVPFGEFVPLRGLFDFVPQLDRVPRDMIRGTDAVVFPTEQGSVGSVISFEGSFARSMRSSALAGAEVMVVTTNTSSYGKSPATDQAIAMVRVNAAAVGLDTAYASITGKSTFIGADGSIGLVTEQLDELALYGALRFSPQEVTLWVRFGDWLAIGSILLAGVALAFPGSRSRSGSSTSETSSTGRFAPSG
ncbi:MAG TPA: apolipoprotein N-acyltransferase [Acidimicrobiia bacterium]|nr:apolipoprotein N-acyltransferase [Acidimicrobiia bacterium]